ncbi:MAG: response regulator transcription factor [Comamonadaceae bacterium]|nr:response regulator transcription factor [Pseudomonadota bacterium]MDE2414382.1 response regulator transcription factor [Comamonadaceae bacterium]
MKFLVVDDHPLVREALSSLLLELRPGAAVLQAATGAGALAALGGGGAVDLVLLDLRLPDGCGLELLRTIGQTSIGTAVVMLSGDLDRHTVQAALAAGAVGYIPKTEPREIIAGALGLVLAGGVYVPPVALPAVAPAALPGRLHEGSVTPAECGLTERQLEVLALLMQGKNNKQICRALGLAEPTVKNHVSAILRALDVGSRTEAVLAVARLGWALPRVDQSR